MTDTRATTAPGGVFQLGGDLPVHRLGYGAMQLTGKGVWGEPSDRGQAIDVLRRAVELGVNFIDTADSYGPYVSEDLIREALRPYREDLVIATKGGLVRTGPDQWIPVGRPAYLRQEVEMSLRRLGTDRIDLYQLHRVDPEIPIADQVGELAKLREEGKIRHIGLSEVDAEQIEEAGRTAPIVSVQNLFNLADRHHEAVLDYAEKENIAFIPWFPMATGELARAGSVLEDAATEHGRSPAQLALAWLLRRSPVVLPIPGTSSVAHVEENIAAADIELTDAEFDALSALA
ncbi:oxidoreductase [Amycolatopsis antarctica]|uniref:Oxidoreductase n=1 Tax=Amycolatopsis antarctica TaxID=1854586 RepID=A0A263D7H5_9PSEU|nr:aldo/keto reductase [Amycolatopsis antarctica]OZM74119.1 oxidoreductase [Amycolatopsis antarctica]